jgi:hypothetical protein
VVNKEPTIQGKMWQCIREIRTRQDAMEKLSLEIEETEDKKSLAVIQRKKEALSDVNNTNVPKELHGLFEEEKGIILKRLNRQYAALNASLEELNTRLKEQQEEANWFLETFKKLEEVEPLKPFDDLESQQKYWNERLTQELNMRLMLKQPIDVELAKTILSLHDEAPIKKQLVNVLSQIQDEQLAKIEETKLEDQSE